mmetsp:Transcript_6496/g.20456  ORF Transcript_6496/g.20456 Transcript_6496/m.20456 type:complete len:224 (+) Transcript_6496:9631-10302(+)
MMYFWKSLQRRDHAALSDLIIWITTLFVSSLHSQPATRGNWTPPASDFSTTWLRLQAGYKKMRKGNYFAATSLHAVAVPGPPLAAAPKGLWGCSPASARCRRRAPRPASVSRRLAHHLRRRSARKPLFSHVVRRLVAATKTQGDDHASSATMLGLGRARQRRDSVDVDVDKLKCRNVKIGPEDRRAMRPATRRSTWHRRRARGWASRDGARRVRAGTEANWGP